MIARRVSNKTKITSKSIKEIKKIKKSCNIDGFGFIQFDPLEDMTATKNSYGLFDNGGFEFLGNKNKINTFAFYDIINVNKIYELINVQVK